VQAKLNANTQGSQRAASTRSPSLLARLVHDEAGQPLVASHACKGKVRYPYDVSKALQQGDRRRGAHSRNTTALAAELDEARFKAANAVAPADEVARRKRAVLQPLLSTLAADLLAKAQGLPASDHSSADIVPSAPVRFSQSGRATRFIQPDDRAVISKVDSSLIDVLVEARCQPSKLSGGNSDITALARAESVNDSWVTRVVRLNFLAPELVTAILDGSQPAALNAAALTSSGPPPMRWPEQVSLLSAR